MGGLYMKRILVMVLLAIPQFLHPCTTLSFVDDQGDRMFGKTFDWYFDHGMVLVNKRNVQKTALMTTEGLPLEWVSKYGSVSFNQHGRDFPLGGMNESGLVVEIMIGPAEDIPSSAEIKNVNEVQLIQYILDSFSNMAELSAGLENIRVARVSSDVHYLVCDKDANCATIEYLNGQLVMHQGESLPYKAFTNSSYEESAKYAAQYEGLGGTQLIPTGSDSLARFARAASRAKNYTSGDGVGYVHSFLDEVALSGRWRIAYKGTGQVSFRTDSDLGSLKEVTMNQDFNCATPVKTFRLDEKGPGEITPRLKDYTVEDNAWLVNANFLLPVSLRAEMVTYPDTHTRCLETPVRE